MNSQVMRLDWGSWVLGDLPEVLVRTMEVVGPSAKVLAGRVYPPLEGRELPVVHLDAASEDEADAMRGSIEGCEFISHFDSSSRRHWVCLVAGLRIQVTVVEVTP